MPVLAERTAISGALSFDPGQQGGIERIALGSVAPLAGALACPLVFSRLFHRRADF